MLSSQTFLKAALLFFNKLFYKLQVTIMVILVENIIIVLLKESIRDL